MIGRWRRERALRRQLPKGRCAVPEGRDAMVRRIAAPRVIVDTTETDEWPTMPDHVAFWTKHSRRFAMMNLEVGDPE